MITYHPVGTNVRCRFLLVDGQGAGLTAQTPTVTIRRRSDGLYWTGAAFQVAPALLAMTEESSANLPGSYYYDFNQATAGGTSEEYLVRYVNAAAFPNRFLSEEQLMFRTFATSLSPERKLQGSLGDDGITFRMLLWIEEGGQRVTDYDSLTVLIYDATGDLVVTVGTDSADNAQGCFSFETPILPIERSKPYVLAVSAVRGVVTDSFNYGFIRC